MAYFHLARFKREPDWCQADLLVAEGFIEPHFFAGFSGGRKSVLPGICAASTVYANHSSHMIDNPNATAAVWKGT